MGLSLPQLRLGKAKTAVIFNVRAAIHDVAHLIQNLLGLRTQNPFRLSNSEVHAMGNLAGLHIQEICRDNGWFHACVVQIHIQIVYPAEFVGLGEVSSPECHSKPSFL